MDNMDSWAHYSRTYTKGLYNIGLRIHIEVKGVGFEGIKA